MKDMHNTFELWAKMYQEQTSINDTPDRQKTQKFVKEQFKLALLHREQDQDIDEIVQAFSDGWEIVLNWLGVEAQERILRETEKELHIDLSDWHGE